MCCDQEKKNNREIKCLICLNVQITPGNNGHDGDRTPAAEVGGKSVTTLPPWPLGLHVTICKVLMHSISGCNLAHSFYLAGAVVAWLMFISN